MTSLDIFKKYNTIENFSYEEFVKPSYSGGHNKWIVKYPKTHIVIDELKEAYAQSKIDFNWITDYFGGSLASYVTGLEQQEVNDLKKTNTISWKQFINEYSINRMMWQTRIPHGMTPEEHIKISKNSMFDDEWKHYAKPRIIDYITAKDLTSKKISLYGAFPDSCKPNKPIQTNCNTLAEFLIKEASFRTISRTQYNIFTKSDQQRKACGIFTREGRLKTNDSEIIGSFVCQISIDELNYKRDLDLILKLWEWRCNRNEKRSVLEEHFGYDTKHMSHVIRLLIGGYNILINGVYEPRLTGENLKFVKGVLNGEYDYDFLVDYATNLEQSLDSAYNESSIPDKPNHKKANKLLLELTRKF